QEQFRDGSKTWRRLLGIGRASLTGFEFDQASERLQAKDHIRPWLCSMPLVESAEFVLSLWWTLVRSQHKWQSWLMQWPKMEEESVFDTRSLKLFFLLVTRAPASWEKPS